MGTAIEEVSLGPDSRDRLRGAQTTEVEEGRQPQAFL